VGAETCKPCHERAHAAWAGSRHAASFRDLEKDGRVHDPDCVSCHVTGFPAESGYAGQGAREPLANVGCESCHGPGGEHAANPAKKPPGDAKAACATCHTPEHSPKYDPERYAAAIRH